MNDLRLVPDMSCRHCHISAISRTAFRCDTLTDVPLFSTHTSPIDLLHPPLTPLRENGLQVAFKQGAGVLEVLFGVGFGGGDAVKRFVEDGDDALLFGEWG